MLWERYLNLSKSFDLAVQMKRSNEKITRRKISFSNYKERVFYFYFIFLFRPPLTFKPHNFHIHFKRFKSHAIRSSHLKFYKSPLNSNSHRATTYKELFGCLELGFVVFSGLFFKFLTSFTLGGRNFLIFNSLLMIVSVSDMPRGGVQVMFGHQQQWNPPFGSSLH
jgi:hypothetical protein